MIKQFDEFIKESNGAYRMDAISDVEGLCNIVGCDIADEETAQMKIESILNYLQEWGVIKEYNADKLDWVFSDEQAY